jgi:hypothetical protein
VDAAAAHGVTKYLLKKIRPGLKGTRGTFSNMPALVAYDAWELRERWQNSDRLICKTELRTDGI